MDTKVDSHTLFVTSDATSRWERLGALPVSAKHQLHSRLNHWLALATAPASFAHFSAFQEGGFCGTNTAQQASRLQAHGRVTLPGGPWQAGLGPSSGASPRSCPAAAQAAVDVVSKASVGKTC